MLQDRDLVAIGSPWDFHLCVYPYLKPEKPDD